MSKANESVTEPSSVDKASYWSIIMDEWESSHTSQQAFCTSKNISFAQFGYWRSRLGRGKKHVPSKPSKELVPVKIMHSSPMVSQGIHIKLPTGLHIAISDGCSVDTIKVTLKLLGVEQC